MQVHDPIVTARTNMATASCAAFCFNYTFDGSVLAVLGSRPNTLVGAKGAHLTAATVVLICSHR
jgi:hypothetical protein